MTLDGAFATAWEAAEVDLVYAVGQGVQTAIAQPTGAYVGRWSRSSGANTLDADAELVYAASAATTKDMAVSAGAYTNAQLTDMTTADSKYGYTETLGESGDAVASAAILKMKAYMPTAAATPSATAETTTTGDRLDKGDAVSVWSALGATTTAPDAECTAAATIVLGAATLAAGSLAAAAALAF